MVDSNARWISLDAEQRPPSMSELHAVAPSNRSPLRRASANAAPVHEILARSFTWMVGPCSRHGGFHPPDAPVPDLNRRGFPINFGLAS